MSTVHVLQSYNALYNSDVILFQKTFLNKRPLKAMNAIRTVENKRFA